MPTFDEELRDRISRAAPMAPSGEDPFEVDRATEAPPMR